ncbi:hypothetical protein EJK15_21030 [Nonomuraea basaltis]|nr:hypothetical protein EJK15_21030 [Nonomuraea basaltis]
MRLNEAGSVYPCRTGHRRNPPEDRSAHPARPDQRSKTPLKRRDPARGGCAPATWNRNRAAVSSWLAWCATKKR